MKRDLSEQERAILADGFEGDFYRVLKKVLDMRRLSIAQLLLEVSDEKELIRNQGGAAELKRLHGYVKDIYNAEINKKK